MKRLNHIILDFEKLTHSSIPNYWVIFFIKQNSINIYNNKIHTKKVKRSIVLNYININFLRKDFLYTKLKYSRSPAYDIVSGGAAVLFAGFLGFLVSEKFGLELVDSGDFYFLIMYLTFFIFSWRPLLTICEPHKSILTIFNFKYVYKFYVTLLFLFLINK